MGMGVGRLDPGRLHSELCEEKKGELCKPYASEADVPLGQDKNTLLKDSEEALKRFARITRWQ